MSASLAGLPYAMQRMPVDGSADMRGDPGVNGLDQQLQILDAGFRKYTVAEVEDVARTAPGSAQHIARALADKVGRPEQDRGVEVALDAVVVTDATPSFVELDSPVEGDDVRTGFGDRLEQAGGVGPEMDPR